MVGPAHQMFDEVLEAHSCRSRRVGEKADVGHPGERVDLKEERALVLCENEICSREIPRPDGEMS